ncbi:MAG: hypothetical protein AAB697_01770 [Patescibacteria group bacterium]
MRKRQKFVLTAAILTFGLGWLPKIPLDYQYWYIALTGAVTLVLFLWSLKEGLNGVEWFTLPVLPVLFTVGFELFSILLVVPSGFWQPMVRGVVLAVFGVSQYALLLTTNIFSVAAIRTIALFRTATAMGFLMTLATGFLAYDAVFSFRPGFWISAPVVVIISFLLLLPSLWSVNLNEGISLKIIKYSVWMAILQGALTVAISFWPVSLTVASLFLTTMLYTYLGIAQHHFSQRLFSKTVWEYVTVGAVVLATMLLTAGLG